MMQVDHEDERHEGPCSVSHGRGASSLLGAGMERGFVVRTSRTHVHFDLGVFFAAW